MYTYYMCYCIKTTTTHICGKYVYAAATKKFLISLRSLHVPGDNEYFWHQLPLQNLRLVLALDRSLMQSYPLIYQFPTTMYVGEYFCTMYILMLMARLSARSLMFRWHLTTILHGNEHYFKVIPAT